MPKPSPRKLSKTKNLEDAGHSVERERQRGRDRVDSGHSELSNIEREMQPESDAGLSKMRKAIRSKVLKEIEKVVKDKKH